MSSLDAVPINEKEPEVLTPEQLAAALAVAQQNDRYFAIAAW
jgi:hypothetical protein